MAKNSRKKWTHDELSELDELHNKKVGINDISEKLGRTKESINKKIREIKNKPKINKSTKNKIIESIKLDDNNNIKQNEIIYKKECKCDFNTQFAFIVNALDEKPNNKIGIKEYLNDKKIQRDIYTNKKFLVCNDGEELIKYESNKKISHFKHKNCVHEEMSEWHKNWQNEFELTEILIGNRYADAVFNDIVIEFQHSYISKETVLERNENYKKNNKTLYWLIDGNDSILIENRDDRYLLKFKNSYWKYENFLNNDNIFIDHDNKIYRIKPNLVKSHMIDIKEFKMKEEFIDGIKNNKNIWSEDELEQCILYHNQRGAGCHQ